MAAPPAEGGRGDGSSEGEDTKMGDDDQSGKKTVSQPAGTGLTEETTEGAFMVVGTVERTRKLLEKLKMPEVELMTPGEWVQRTWFAKVPNSPLLELAIAAAAAGKWVIASMEGCDVSWRFEVKGAPPPKRNQRQSPTKPSVMPSVVPQRAAGATPANAWGRPLSHMSQRVHTSPLSTEEVSAQIKKEVASLLAQHEQQLAAATAEVKRQEAEITVKDAVITSLKEELAALKGQAKSSANSAAASSPPDLQGPPEKQERSEWLREIRGLTKDVREIAQKHTAVQVEQIRRDGDVAAIAQSLSALRRQLDTLQQLTESEKEDRRSQRVNQSQATQLQPKTRLGRNGPTGATVLPPETFVFGGKVYQQPLPAAPVWPVHHEGLVFEPAAPARMAPAEPEDEKAPAVERLEPETGADGEGNEAGAEGEQKPEDVWQVAPQLATPAKLPPAVLDVEACSKTPPVKTTRVRSPGDTPSRAEVLRQNAADRMAGMEDDTTKWAVVVAVPKEVRELSAAEGSEQQEAAPLVRRGPLFEDQNFPL